MKFKEMRFHFFQAIKVVFYLGMVYESRKIKKKIYTLTV